MMNIEGRLDSWKRIAVYLQKDERTVQRWHSQRGLPVHHIPGSKQSSVFAYSAEIDAWLISSSDKESAVRKEVQNAEERGLQSCTSRALALWECRSETNLIRIVDLCRDAIVENPMDSEAFGVMGSTYMWSVYVDVLPSSYALPRASRAVDRALAVNPRQVHALATQAWLTMCCNRDRKLAQSQFAECLSIQPGNAFALVGLATSLSTQGDLNEALRLMARAWQNEPLSASMPYVAVRMEYYAAEFLKVLSQAHLAKRSGEDSSGLRSLVGLASTACGRIIRAESELKMAAGDYPESILVRGVLGYIYAISERQEEARLLLAQLVREEACKKASAAYAIALVYCGLDERDETFYWLEKGCSEWSMWLWALELDNAFAPLRGDRRFSAIIERLQIAKHTVSGLCIQTL